ncbi:MAG: nitrate reductase cytochrome c-type subunit [Alphaproteobacteria bacterium]|jgi:cytochrome c-type protein NapB|nr:nitrate reductase cytochrome c-type subunit [Alphaproteobacteria bacterium]
MKITAFILALTTAATAAWAADPIATLRGPAPLVEQGSAPAMAKVSDEDLRRMRNYPEQPPTIPHSIRGYQINTSANKCMSCHSRRATATSKAPMVSITHFMDRDGQFLASVSPRRYFCTQCHVTQQVTGPLVDNVFVDVDSVLSSE